MNLEGILNALCESRRGFTACHQRHPKRSVIYLRPEEWASLKEAELTPKEAMMVDFARQEIKGCEVILVTDERHPSVRVLSS